MSNYNTRKDPRSVFGRMLALPIFGGVIVSAILVLSVLRSGNKYDLTVLQYVNTGQHAMSVADQWRASARADSLGAWVRELTSADDSPAISIEPGIPRAIAVRMDSALRAEWSAIGRSAQGVRVAALVVFDTMSTIGGLQLSGTREPQFVLPSRLDGRTCVVIVPVSKLTIMNPALLDGIPQFGLSRLATLGTCAFFAAFGAPGAGASAWLEQSGMSRAIASRWWALQETRKATANAVADSSQSHDSLSTQNRYQDRLREAIHSPGISNCRGGNRDACASLLVTPPRPVMSIEDARDIDAVPGIPRGITSSASWSNQNSTYGRMLAQLVRTYGVERVGQAWRGSGPFIDALAKSVNADVADLGASWVNTGVPAIAREQSSVTAGGVFAVVLVAASMLGVALVTARGRERG